MKPEERAFIAEREAMLTDRRHDYADAARLLGQASNAYIKAVKKIPSCSPLNSEPDPIPRLMGRMQGRCAGYFEGGDEFEHEEFASLQKFRSRLKVRDECRVICSSRKPTAKRS